jgi:phosphopantetheinyl transferase (holo-ACP synthase)
MNPSDQLREMVATMLMVQPSEVDGATSLRGLDTSLGGARLRLGVKRLGSELPANFVPITFGQLEAALSGNPVAAVPSAAIAQPVTTLTGPPMEGVQVGLDIENVKSLPVTSDYWEHEFYQGMFGKSEIAYAVLEREPRIHLAGFWCAKEALRKCDPSFASAGFETTVVEHEASGRPYLMWQSSTGNVRLPHALSLSHTGELATAVVVAIATPAAPARAEEASLPQLAPARERMAGKFLIGVLFLLAMAAAGYWWIR